MAEYSNGDKNLALRDVTLEIWKRILNNLPYMYKTKGSIKGIKALLTCYGIPSTILRVKEYGGPDPDPDLNILNEYKFDNFSYAINFYGNQYIKIPWSQSTLGRYPNTIEFRFQSTASSYTHLEEMSIVDSKGLWSIQIISTGGDKGKLRFQLLTSTIYTSATTSEMPMFDGKFTSVVLQRQISSDAFISQTYNLYAKKYMYGSIYYAVSASLDISASQNVGWVSSSNLYIAGDGSYEKKFSGSIDEFRLWDVPLSNSTIDSHVKFPQSIIGNDVTSSYNDLLLRFSFDNPKNHVSASLHSGLINEAPLGKYSVSNITMSNWPNENTFPYSYLNYEYESEAHSLNIGSQRFSSNKVRIVSSSLRTNLSPFEIVENDPYDNIDIDSNKIGIFFSPNAPVDEDIIKSVAISDHSILIGDPSDYYRDSYSLLKDLNKIYWAVSYRRISIKDYVNYIKNYDKSLFDNIRDLLPARSKPVLGLLFEPTILERPKVKFNKPEIVLDKKEVTIKTYDNIPLTASVQNLSVIYDINDNIKISGNNFSKSNIYSIIDNSNNYGFNGDITETIMPIVDFDTNYEYFESGGLKIRFTEIQSYSFTEGYNKNHYIRYNLFGTWEKRIKYTGCLNTDSTTIDKKSPIEVWETNPNRLIVRDDGRAKLQVE